MNDEFSQIPHILAKEATRRFGLPLTVQGDFVGIHYMDLMAILSNKEPVKPSVKSAPVEAPKTKPSPNRAKGGIPPEVLEFERIVLNTIRAAGKEGVRVKSIHKALGNRFQTEEGRSILSRALTRFRSNNIIRTTGIAAGTRYHMPLKLKEAPKQEESSKGTKGSKYDDLPSRILEELKGCGVMGRARQQLQERLGLKLERKGPIMDALRKLREEHKVQLVRGAANAISYRLSDLSQEEIAETMAEYLKQFGERGLDQLAINKALGFPNNYLNLRSYPNVTGRLIGGVRFFCNSKVLDGTTVT